ncbi:MAG: hypothetical protein ACYTDT_07450 [Planctomycetota bacterium]
MTNTMKIALLATLLISTIGGAALLLIPPDEPPINHGGNDEDEPEPDPTPKGNSPGPHVDRPDIPPPPVGSVGPSTTDEAELWLEDVTKAMNHIRSRIEYKYQTSGRKLEKQWTIAELVRRPERAESERFVLSDFELSYVAEPEPTFSIRCETSRGKAMAAGALTMTVTLGSGKVEFGGYPYALGPNGGVLLSKDAQEHLIENVHRQITHHFAKRNDENPQNRYWRRKPTNFDDRLKLKTDLKTTRTPEAISFEVTDISEQPLSETITGSFNHTRLEWTNNGAIDFYPDLPTTASDLDDEWWFHNYVVKASANEDYLKEERTWRWTPIYILPGDVEITHKAGKTTGKIVSSWGRKLPFDGPSYTYDPSIEED